MLPTQSKRSSQRMPTERTAHVLIVEDEASLSDSIRYNLEREGFTATVAADGVRALERVRAEPFALVILDLMLPELSASTSAARSAPSPTSRSSWSRRRT